MVKRTPNNGGRNMENFRKAYGSEGLTFILLVQAFIDASPHFHQKQEMGEAIREGLETLSKDLRDLTT